MADREVVNGMPNVDLIETERRVLGALCKSSCEAALRKQARELLAQYQWEEQAHREVFDIIMSFPIASVEALREQLPARLTRRGFPDFDFDGLFAGPVAGSAEVELWIYQLAERQ